MHEVTPQDIARHLEIPVSSVLKHLDFDKSTISLNAYQKKEPTKPLTETLACHNQPSPELQLEEENTYQTLLQWIEKLEPELKLVLTRRYGLDGNAPVTLEEVGQELGYNRERIRRMQMQGVENLKSLAKEHS